VTRRCPPARWSETRRPKGALSITSSRRCSAALRSASSRVHAVACALKVDAMTPWSAPSATKYASVGCAGRPQRRADLVRRSAARSLPAQARSSTVATPAAAATVPQRQPRMRPARMTITNSEAIAAECSRRSPTRPTRRAGPVRHCQPETGSAELLAMRKITAPLPRRSRVRDDLDRDRGKCRHDPRENEKQRRDDEQQCPAMA